jgi:histone-lysine N-methyltransferase SETMAR
VNVETKEQSKQWMHTHSPNRPEKFKQMSARKLMAAVLWDRKGVLMVEFMQQGTTIISEVYCRTLKKLCRAIQNKRHGEFLHDHACLRTAARTRALLEHFNWEMFYHSPYSPDLALSEYHLFACTYLKNWL